MIINTNNSPKKRRLEEKEDEKNLDKSKAIKLLVLCVLAIIVIIATQIYKSYMKNFNYMKVDRGEHIVYTRYNQNSKEVPYVNINSSDVKSLNDSIVDYCNNYVNSDDIKIKYEYSINGNYLSLVIKVINTKELPSKMLFKTYNVSLKNRTVLTDQDLTDYFKVNNDIVSARIHNRFLEMYKDEVAQGYIEEMECDYTCYLGYRGVTDYLEDINYYIRDGKLVVYKPFIYSSIFGEEEYFTEDSFIFELTE